jgi:23S rRNA (adenine2503-C2)-methyltransferase
MRRSCAAAVLSGGGGCAPAAAAVAPAALSPLPHVLQLSPAQLAHTVARAGLAPSSAADLRRHVCRTGRGLAEWNPALSDARRRELARLLTTDGDALDGARIVADATAADGTRKFLIAFGGDGDGQRRGLAGAVETVFIPDVSAGGRARGTLCVSSQVGCSLACAFCATGAQGFGRNLTAAQILAQVVLAKRALGDYDDGGSGDDRGGDVGADAAAATARGLDGGRRAPAAAPPPATSTAPARVTNVVFMGQGEPLLNYAAVAGAVGVLVDPWGFELARRRVTVSTAGVAPAIPAVGSALGVSLALSLHAPNDALRSQLMRINRTYPLAAVLAACRAYASSRGPSFAPRKVLVEYALLDGVNDSAAHAHQLADLLAPQPAGSGGGLPRCAVNLIPFNPWPGARFAPSPDAAVGAFASTLAGSGLPATVRWPRGRDIAAACGQLRTEERGGQARRAVAAAVAS